MGTLRTAFLSALALELIATISVAVVAVFVGVRLVHGDMALEAGLLALILAPDCYLPLRELGTAHHASDEGRAALAETTAVLEAPEAAPLVPAAASAAAVVGAASGSREPAAPPTLSVAGLTVRYGGRTDAAVGPLSFTAAPGRITALDGPSGAGKSTVLGVLAGTIGTGGGPDQKTTVTGRIAGFTTADLAWVPQHPVMAAPTVLDEVRLYLGVAGGGPTAPAIRGSPRTPTLSPWAAWQPAPRSISPPSIPQSSARGSCAGWRWPAVSPGSRREPGAAAR